jgi:hypothetical protein
MVVPSRCTRFGRTNVTTPFVSPIRLDDQRSGVDEA